MKRASLITIALLSALSASHAAWAVDYPLPPANSRLIGENQFWTVQEDMYSEDPQLSAAAMSRTLERYVRAYPSQYLWSMKRFKKRPDGEKKWY